MKKLLFLSLIISIITVFAFKGGEAYKTLAIGDKAPMLDYTMMGTDGAAVNLESKAKENGTLVIFSCNTCPFVIAWEDRYPELAEVAENNDIGMVLINSNEAKREGDDSVDKMIEHAKKAGYETIPYLEDKNSKLANAFGAKTTPHVFLFDKEWNLVYEGAIDDNYKDANAVTAKYLENAMENLSKGDAIDPSNTKALGCSIKRVKS